MINKIKAGLSDIKLVFVRFWWHIHISIHSIAYAK